MDLFNKAAELGIQTGFTDGQGHWHSADVAALKLIIDAIPTRTSHRFVEQAIVLRVGRSTRTPLLQDATLPLNWKIEDGAGVAAEGEATEAFIDWPQHLPVGVYQVTLRNAQLISETLPLLVAERSGFSGGFDRSWLLAVQLYSLRSATNWGIGDFTDLTALIDFAADCGAGGVGLNPLHALMDDHPSECSPYAPNSRLFLNPLYIDVTKVPGYVANQNQGDLAALRSLDFVDYVNVSRVKHWAMLQAFRSFYFGEGHEAARARFEAYRTAKGKLLSRFASFEVLRHRYGGMWWEWPEHLRYPDDAVCDELREGHDADEVRLIEFSQWLAAEQLEACAAHAKSRGMPIGLYLDVAVGVQAGGFDAWHEQAAISRSLSVGAPPDPLSLEGQNWGLAGFHAAGLEARSFEPFRDMLRASMAHAGAIRLDHILGLNRLYLIPQGLNASKGAYVKMPFDAMLAVAVQESMAASCVIIGEDLGTVPEGFRETLADYGIWSYQVVMFERDWDGSFRAPDRYMRSALVTFNTHDLPSYAGWRSMHDLAVKRAIGIDPGETDDGRQHAIWKLDERLRELGIERTDFNGIIGFLERTPSRLKAISLEDLLKVEEQPNVPGTIDQHPNWRRRLPVQIEQLREAVDMNFLREHLPGSSR